jgi:glycosyltransferase involved in cell wall biosynthesis
MDPASVRPLVSIITPTYSHEGFIESCIRSVLAQRYDAWELIVVDDASPDRTPEIVAQLAASDPRIRLIRHTTNYGPYRLSDTYNEALALAGGELIAVLEGDDEWIADKLAQQVPVFRDPRVVLSYADYDEVTVDGLLIHRHGIRDAIAADRSGPSANLHFFSWLKSLGANTVMARAATLRQIGGFCRAELPLVDYPTWLRLATLGEFVRVPQVCGIWRRHPGSVYYAQEYATLERLQEHFLGYLQRERHQLLASGFTHQELATLGSNARRAVQLKQRSKSYFEGKYHLLMNRRLKALGPFGKAIFSPGTALRHRLGALAGMLAAVTSPRLITSLSRIMRPYRPGH